jgi:regulator of ribonuclease activity A
MPSISDFATADLADEHRGAVQMVALPWRRFGARTRFAGPAATVATQNDNQAIRAMLDQPGDGRVLVIDSGGQLTTAMLGDRLAALAVTNDWAGVIINGPVRDSAAMAEVDLGVRALGTTALRSFDPAPVSTQHETVSFGGVTIAPGVWIYADADAVLVSERRLIG